MTVGALSTAATGLNALSSKLDVIANNLANVNTIGFKRSRTNFEDLFYQVKRQPGAENSQGDIAPAGVMVGNGVQLSSTQMMFEQGGVQMTDRPLDVRIDGDGFFQVKIFEDLGPNGIGYTRAGNFFVNANGELVLGNRNGFRIEPPLTIPEDATDVSITSDGTVLTLSPGDDALQDQGQIQLARFVNPEGLVARGQNIYVESAASGPPAVSNPTEEGAGAIMQGGLEMSNVEPVTELVDLIQTQRAFELNSQSIKAADEMLRVVSRLRG